MSTPYKKLQQQCKAEGLPANKSTAELTRLLAEHTSAEDATATDDAPMADTDKVGTARVLVIRTCDTNL